MAEYKGVMVCAEVSEGKLAAIATELLGCGRKLADDLGEELSVVLVGREVGSLAQEAIASGADKAYIVEEARLEDYQADAYLPVMEKVVRQVMPQILLLGQTAMGRDLAPRLAFRLEARRPNVLARFISDIMSEDRSRVLEGMHPRRIHSPPSGPLSTMATFAPASAAVRAAA